MTTTSSLAVEALNGGNVTVPAAGEAGVLRALLPDDVVVVETSEPAPLGILLAEERAAIASSVPQRAVEFATGRWSARRAMARIGIHDFPLLPNPDRAPMWPAGIVGSITHTEGYCAAVASLRDGYAGIGIDAEIAGRAGVELWSLLFTTEEIDWLERLPLQRRSTMATVLFSAKESFYKAQYALTHAWVDFQAAMITVDGNSWNLDLIRPQGALANLRLPLRGRFATHDRLVVTAIAIDLAQLVRV